MVIETVDTMRCKKGRLAQKPLMEAINSAKILAFSASFVAGSFAVIPAAHAQPATTLNYVQPLGTSAIRDVQQRLRQAGVYSGNVDGIWGADSRASLRRFQETHSLQVTGELNQATAATLGLQWSDLLSVASTSPAASPTPAPTTDSTLRPEVVRIIQGRLGQLGFYTGAVDGIWGPNMQTAIERFQQGRALQPTGQLNPATITAMGLDPNNLLAPARQ
jgi:peptidoglycan hydrolase-like protein with peptidoglycan-binding domain